MADEQQKQTETPAQESESGAQAEPVLEPGAESVEIPAEEAVDSAALQQELEQAQAEIADLQKQLSELQPRAQAEIQNVRRRAEQDVEKARKFALEKFTGELLPVVDSLERAIEACQAEDEATQALKEGVEMTLKLLLDGLGKFNVEMVDPHGETFNPEHHQAMSMVEDPNADPNTVVAVMQKGYLLNGRLVRPAMVMVAKG
ncbi:MAG: nucleotide exchange factor GrpE [Oceanospirillaceae bacterium]|jgi:molecular chaperone GrpE|uniref:nucleotide exchange factor GrpE n=1 Tax=Marinobacterium litorale TaxID=404770 RepID=UPI000421218D|nr:nucleotide exchange factor GrpE [Marinobacterium litorale]MBS98721.1 nucleotide exchange factor GrpE [Oceanospirillaceae bacterium]